MKTEQLKSWISLLEEIRTSEQISDKERQVLDLVISEIENAIPQFETIPQEEAFSMLFQIIRLIPVILDLFYDGWLG